MMVMVKSSVFKGRLVDQGFSQRYGVDYEEIFLPLPILYPLTLPIVSIRIY